MDEQELAQTLRGYSARNLDQRKQWYSPAAAAYDRVRPRYPAALVHQVVAIAQISPTSKILEIGCGPATATVSFAPLGSAMLCLEPNPDFCAIAQRHCQPYPNVVLQNTSFEEWELDANHFDVVLAATSFHWIPPEIGYPKAAQALRDNGYLILLWNKELQPSYEMYQHLSQVYQIHAPGLDRYEDEPTQNRILQGLGQHLRDSDQFNTVISGEMRSEVTYSLDDYLTLLNTYSPYLALEPQTQTALFRDLRDRIDQESGGVLPLSYLSAFHIAQKTMGLKSDG